MADRYKLPNEVFYDGMTLPSNFIQPKLVEKIKDFKTLPGDVLLTSYPRSGNTWTIESLFLLMTNGDFETAKSKTFMERTFFLELIPDAKSSGDSADSTIAKAQEAKSAHGRLLKTHVHFRHIKKQLIDEKVKTVVVCRNPKDMLVSLYHFYKDNLILGYFDRDWNEFFELFRNKQMFYGDWLEWIKGYWEQRENKNIFFVKYEDSKSDIKKQLRRMAEFLEKDVTDDLIDRIADHVSFQKMNNNPMTNEKVLQSLGFMNEDGKFIRKGSVGQWKDYFTDEQSRYVDEHYLKKMEEMGLKFRLE